MKNLTRAAREAECIYGLVHQGKMDKAEFVHRMNELEQQGDGLLATGYCSWLLLRHTPNGIDREMHMSACAHNCGRQITNGSI